MILVDTSVWVDHLSRGAEGLASLLDEETVVMHPFVIGELACGDIRNRRQVLHLLGALPAAPIASDDEALAMIESHRLMAAAWDGWMFTSSRRRFSEIIRFGRETSSLPLPLRL